jgi:RNA polymerase sigma factor (sigma-70 family)
VTPAARADELSLVAAAQAGDRRALAELVTAYLPLVYTIARRALGHVPDVDDVVQETMLRVLRELGALRTPESFRPWLMTITTRQVSTFLRRWQAAAERTVALDEVVDPPAAAAEDLAVLRLELSGQRRQVARASRWLDPDDLVPLSLWWLESAGRLTRTELASALGRSVAHAGVCVQRVRNRLESARSLVAALDAVPRCAGLVEALEGWSGVPSPLWRKRILRHVRSCPTCHCASARLLPPERLFECLALFPVTDPIAEICYVERRPESPRRCEPHSARDPKYIDVGLLNVRKQSGNVQYIDG